MCTTEERPGPEQWRSQTEQRGGRALFATEVRPEYVVAHCDNSVRLGIARWQANILLDNVKKNQPDK